MRKILVLEELICPFDKCRISSAIDEEDKGMNVNCKNCEYIWNRKSAVMFEEGCVYLDENSKECKEYEALHKVECIDVEEENKGGLPRHSKGYYQDFVEALNEVKDKPISETIVNFNKNIVEDLRKKKCAYCDKQIIGKGVTVHDTFGEIDYVFCNRECAYNYRIKYEA